MGDREYVYRVELLRLKDGDSYRLRVHSDYDFGFRLIERKQWDFEFRANLLDTPELRRGSDFEKAKAREATEFVREWFEENDGNVWGKTIKPEGSDDMDSFSRWFIELFTLDPEGERVWLRDDLMQRDLATVWPTRWRDVYDNDGEAN